MCVGGVHILHIVSYEMGGGVHIILQIYHTKRGGFHIFRHICHIHIFSYLIYLIYTTYCAYNVLSFNVLDNSCSGFELSDDENEDIQPPQDAAGCDLNQSQGQPVSAPPFLHAPPVPTLQFLCFSTAIKRPFRFHAAIYF